MGSIRPGPATRASRLCRVGNGAGGVVQGQADRVHIEELGSGTVDMFDICKETGLQPPVFDIDARHFTVTVYRPVFDEKGNRVSSEIGQNDTEVKVKPIFRGSRLEIASRTGIHILPRTPRASRTPRKPSGSRKPMMPRIPRNPRSSRELGSPRNHSLSLYRASGRIRGIERSDHAIPAA